MEIQFEAQDRKNSIYLLYLSSIGQEGEHVFKYGKTTIPFTRF